MKILIIDDSDTSRTLLSVILKGVGLEEQSMAASARDGIEILKSDSGRDIDLILMDLTMPEMDGIEATRVIKGDPIMADIPIIMVTARDDEESLDRAFAAGASDYISKPVGKIELRARVKFALKLKEEMDRRKAREEELEQLNREFQELSNRDGLTNVANRRCFDDVFNREWLRSIREETPLSLLMIDIDFFKKYNDYYGHIKGDDCLKKVARAICDSARRPGDFVARYGGEEFVVLLPNTDEDGAHNRSSDIQHYLLKAAIRHETSEVSDLVTVSIGVATVRPSNGNDPENLISISDQAMYMAKQQGRNRICTEKDLITN